MRVMKGSMGEEGEKNLVLTLGDMRQAIIMTQ